MKNIDILEKKPCLHNHEVKTITVNGENHPISLVIVKQIMN